MSPPRPAIALSLTLALLLAGRASAAAPALQPPPPEVVAEARALVAAMRAAERGPYSRLRWYCKDGTVHPPTPYACAQRGGGRQHAEYSLERRRLAELGWSVGTIVAALGWEELWDAGRRQQRLRELPLERYLVEVDDGWVLRRARHYRGRVQIEDEEQAGRELLVRLLSNPGWLQRNFLLAREAVRALPHHGGVDRTRAIRRLSQEIADRDSSFERLRIKIHTSPGLGDLQATRDWIAAARGRGAAAELVKTAETLAAELDKLYGGGDWLAAARAGLARHPRWGELEPLLAEAGEETAADRLERLGRAASRVREIVSTAADGAGNLTLLDLSVEIEREAIAAAFEALGKEALSRRDHLALARRLLELAYGAGLHSSHERDALAGAIAPLFAGPATTAELVAAVQALRRAAPWALATVRFTFAEPLVRYTALEPKAARFVDDLLRGSALLPLAEAVTRLAGDADHLAGVAHRAFGEVRGGMLGLNPGVARGRLRVVGAAELDRGVELGRDEIVVLPETVSELTPVAGILSLAEGNLLSHVQILARNLGIPNATLSPLLARRLAEQAGREVVLAVGTDGSVVLESWQRVPAAARELLGGERSGGASPAARVAAPRPDLSLRRPLGLAELHAGLSGRVVGPKAANLGELARQFPGRVGQAVALPFGVFADHLTAGSDPPKARLDRAFARHRAGQIDAAELAAEVEAVRLAVERLRLGDATRAELGALMDQLFGPAGTYGAFVRSDTNVEDLPGFTGAGLNKTVANLVDRERLFAAVPQVWSSPYSERAMAWRSGILERPEEVYASVLIMKSVPADKSGVLVTSDLATRGEGLTVATAWGVGGAVDGEAAETLVLRPDGGSELISEAKAPYRRRLAAGGGVEWVPAEGGQVLAAEERNQLRRLAREAASKLAPARSPAGEPLPWDIEFGFVDGELTLFQVRPLVERGQQRADRAVAALAPAARRRPAGTVDLDAPLAAD